LVNFSLHVSGQVAQLLLRCSSKPAMEMHDPPRRFVCMLFFGIKLLWFSPCFRFARFLRIFFCRSASVISQATNRRISAACLS
jgi:hypothetical protein